ncbi:MAG: ATP cone domain-containing protein, partial [Candidatus Pacearchaeota archaeon]|nr:ATP cone domain-containing protein [Candidatus Pacearchaeota archaeon]
MIEKKKKIPRVVKKRDGMLVPFDESKIEKAIKKSFESVGHYDEKVVKSCTEKTLEKLSGNGNMPNVDYINEMAIKSIKELGFENVANSFMDYSEKRREVRILGEKGHKSSTDSFLMVASQTDDNSLPWNRNKIRDSLIEEAYLDLETAQTIAKVVENTIVLSGMETVTTGIIREVAGVELMKKKLFEAAERYKNFTIPKSDLEKIIGEKNDENSNIKSNNPEAVNFTISGKIGKEYALSRVFDGEIAKAHSDAEIHLHDLDLITRVYCSAHSLEYLKKYGLELDNLQTSSSPPKHTETLTGHLNTFFAAMQAYYAGALGVGYFNIMYAPLIESDLKEKGLQKIADRKKQLTSMKENYKFTLELQEIIEKEEMKLGEMEKEPMTALTDDEVNNFMKQRGQEAIYAASQNAFSRGGQTLFIDFNIHTGVPAYMKDTLAVLIILFPN